MRRSNAIQSTIRYYMMPLNVALLRGRRPRLSVKPVDDSGEIAVNVARWRTAPHVALANLRRDPKAVLWFTRTYGVLSLDCNRVFTFRDDLRRAWEGKDYFPFVTVMETTVRLWPHVHGLRTGMEIAVRDLGKLIGLMFARDLWEGRLKKCGNPDCITPYFRAVRKGQKFCSQKCAVLISVRCFREREATRRERLQKKKGWRKDRKARQKGRTENQKRERGKHAKAEKT